MIDVDIKKVIDNLRKIVTVDSKVLNISHNDMDGVGCNIIINNSFKDVTSIYSSYNDIDETLSKINFDKYDIVIISDISPEENTDILEKYKNKIILLDHHETSKHLHNPEYNCFIDIENSGTMLCKIFCETVLGISLSYLDELVFLINDYDLWIHVDKRSKQLNILFYYYWERKFYSRFFEGMMEFDDIELDYIKKIENDIELSWNNLEFHVMGSVNIAICDGVKYVNDLSEKLLFDKEENIDIVIFRNIKNQKMSVRSKSETFNLGLFLQENNLGGGHSKAGAIQYENLDDFRRKMDIFEKEIYKNVPEFRSQD